VADQNTTPPRSSPRKIKHDSDTEFCVESDGEHENDVCGTSPSKAKRRNSRFQMKGDGASTAANAP
jgi:hypothetical protein